MWMLIIYIYPFWSQGMWDLSSSARDGTHTHYVKGKVLTTGLPGKSRDDAFCVVIDELRT